MNALLEPKEFRALVDEGMKAGLQGTMLNLEHLERVMKLLPKDAIGLEIGCFKGDGSVWFLEHGIQTLHVIDTFKGSAEHEGMDLGNLERQFTENVAKYWTRLHVFNGRSLDMLGLLNNRRMQYDFVYVDASHDSRDVITDACLGFKLLKPGGVMVMDDYLWNYFDESYRNPMPAIDFFLGAFADELRVIEMGYQVSIQKL